jgi:3D (Asp-Asp-Asp) domain-containing protein
VNLHAAGSHKVGRGAPALWYGPPTVSGRRTRSAARLAGLAAVLALTAGSGAAAAGPGSGYRQKAAQLQVQAQRLDTRAHKALLDLYAYESRLGAARGRVAALSDRSRRLRSRQRTLGAQLTAARRTLAVSQRQLAEHLRSLYEEGRPDTLAVVLGAQSLDDAVSKLDTLTRMADESRRVVAATSAAQVRLSRVRTQLAAQRRRLEQSLAAARTAERQLADARAARLSFVHDLQAQQRLKQTQIRGLLATAHSVEQKAQELQAAAVAPAPADPAAAETVPGGADTTSAAPASPPARGSNEHAGGTLRVSATGYSLPGHTATGMPVGWGVVAVDPSVIPLGTRLTIPGYGEAVAADVGSAVHGAMIDLWFPSLAQARAWGRRTVTITLH